jgi:hypothetical protein
MDRTDSGDPGANTLFALRAGGDGARLLWKRDLPVPYVTTQSSIAASCT